MREDPPGERAGEKRYADGYATLTDTQQVMGYSLIRCLFGLFGLFGLIRPGGWAIKKDCKTLKIMYNKYVLQLQDIFIIVCVAQLDRATAS